MATTKVTSGVVANNSIDVTKLKREGTSSHVLTSKGTGADPAYELLDADPELGFSNVSSWADDAVETITLTKNALAIGKAQVNVWEEIADANKTNADWNVTSGDTGFDLINSAYSQTLTPAATTGSSVAFTMGGGTFASDDVGKRIVNVSAGENGVARIKSVASNVATCSISTTFTDTNAIASGDWELYAGEFIDNTFSLSGATTLSGVRAFNSDIVAGMGHGFRLVKLDTEKFLYVYLHNSDTRKAKCVVITTSNNTISVGAIYAFTTPASSTDRINYVPVMDALSSTKVVMHYQAVQEGGSAPDYGCSIGVVCLSISGTTISQGTALMVQNNFYIPRSVSKIDSTRALLTYNGAGSVFSRVVSLSGTTLSLAPVITIPIYPYFTFNLSSTKAIGFGDNSAGNKGVANVFTISGSGASSTVSRASDSEWLSVVPYNEATTRAAQLDTDKFIIVYTKSGLAKIWAKIVTASGTTVSAGAEKVMVDYTAEVSSVSVTSATAGVLFFDDSGSPGSQEHLTAQQFTVSGTTITLGEITDLYDENNSIVRPSGGSDDLASLGANSSTHLSVTAKTAGATGHQAVLYGLQSLAYVADQYVATISGSDTVDTSFYSDLNSVTTTETLNGHTASYALSVNPTQTSTVVTGGSFIIVGASQTATRTIATSLNSVHGGTDGVWFINTNTSYGSATWGAASTNEAKAALEQAMATAVNHMTGTALNAISDSNLPAFGTKFALAMILKSTSSSATPVVTQVAFNYDGDVINRINPAGYTVEMPSTSVVKVTAPSSGGPRNARVYITK